VSHVRCTLMHQSVLLKLINWYCWRVTTGLYYTVTYVYWVVKCLFFNQFAFINKWIVLFPTSVHTVLITCLCVCVYEKEKWFDCTVWCELLYSFEETLESLDDFSHRAWNTFCIPENKQAVQHRVCV
jgi:hypothetical protein